MDKIVVKMHPTELIGTCADNSGDCATLDGQLAELADRGLDTDSQDIVREQRVKQCGKFGHCTLYYGERAKISDPTVTESN